MDTPSIDTLQHSSLQRSVQLLQQVFPKPPLSEHPCLALPLSLAPPIIAKPILRLSSVRFLQYWVIQTEQRVLGITGLYSQWEQPDTYWLGWTCVQPDVRRQGLGGQLLDFAITQARREGKQVLRVYMSVNDAFEAAQRLYASRGFKHYENQPSSGTPRLYLQLDLSTKSN